MPAGERMDDGLVDASWWRARQDAYLEVATGVWAPADPLNVAEHLERHRRRPDHEVALTDLGDAVLAEWFLRIDGGLDCADFDVLRLLQLWFLDRADLPAEVTDALRQRLLAFRYWYTDPAPPDLVDQRWYWSENHRLIFHTVEHLAGQALPDATFTSDGATGAEHEGRATALLHAWFDEKARYGFTEWHSDVYYEKDLAPLLTLAEHSADERIAARATCFLDLLLFDIALHTHRGNVGGTHGRSYMKDKSRATDQPLFAPVKLLFDDTVEPWIVDGPDRDPRTARNEGATLLARARRYRPPEVIRRVATSDQPMVDREHVGIAIDPREPLADHPVRDDGLAWDDPDLVPFWWDRNALTCWQAVATTMDVLDRDGRWDADLFAAFRGVRDVTGGDRAIARQLAHDLADLINAGLLSEVETVTYRTGHVMLSTALDYRRGCAGYQHHITQATLDERAIVFTTHPGNEPWPDPRGFADGDRYWTGSATLPRAVQHGPAAVVQYAPAFASPELDVLAGFRYLDETHAFLPTECFDEVVGDGHWTFARRGDGYVGVWSWRPVHWRQHDPAVVCTNGLTRPFDLVAAGGAANVWLIEVGDADRWPSFGAFRAALAGAAITVTERGPRPEGGHAGFDVAYASPGAGHLSISWDGPFAVDGVEVPLDAGGRFDNPWCRAERGATRLTIADGACSVDLDLATGDRRAVGPGTRVDERPAG